MVEIILLSFFNGIAEINCFPEGNAENSFQLTLDVNNQKIIKNTLNTKGNAYAIHAAWKMFDEFLSKKALPEKATVIWC